MGLDARLGPRRRLEGRPGGLGAWGQRWGQRLASGKLRPQLEGQISGEAAGSEASVLQAGGCRGDPGTLRAEGG